MAYRSSLRIRSAVPQHCRARSDQTRWPVPSSVRLLPRGAAMSDKAVSILPLGLKSGVEGVCRPVFSGCLDQALALLHTVVDAESFPSTRLKTSREHPA